MLDKTEFVRRCFSSRSDETENDQKNHMSAAIQSALKYTHLPSGRCPNAHTLVETYRHASFPDTLRYACLPLRHKLYSRQGTGSEPHPR